METRTDGTRENETPKKTPGRDSERAHVSPTRFGTRGGTPRARARLDGFQKRRATRRFAGTAAPDREPAVWKLVRPSVRRPARRARPTPRLRGRRRTGPGRAARRVFRTDVVSVLRDAAPSADEKAPPRRNARNYARTNAPAFSVFRKCRRVNKTDALFATLSIRKQYNFSSREKIPRTVSVYVLEISV